MNTTLEQIQPETMTRLETQAKHLGLSIDEYLRRLLPQIEPELALAADPQDDDFEKDMLAFAEGTEHLPIHNGNYSREDIYFDHD